MTDGIDNSVTDIVNVVNNPVAAGPVEDSLNQIAELGPEEANNQIQSIASQSSTVEAVKTLGKYVAISVTIVAIWVLGGKSTVEDLGKALGNALSDIAKRLIGAFQAVGEHVADAGASVFKLPLIIVSICLGVGLIVGLGVHYGMKARKKSKQS